MKTHKGESGLLGIVVHGGAGSSSRLKGGCRKACEAGYALLSAGASALDAAVEAARIMEDDGRFNAGSGSTLRLDGRTIEMDASCMDSAGRLGSVMAVRDVRNPVLLARAVAETPHVALAGPGASLFARARKLEGALSVSRQALLRYRKMIELIRSRGLGEHDSRWHECDLSGLWNFETPYGEIFPNDTISAVAIDRQGTTAAANSTGGASPMLLGRVGDTPMIGCGFYAGPAAAVAATGIGEEIIRKMLSKTVYDLIAEGVDVQAACEAGVGLFPAHVPVGLIAITRSGYGIASNRQMAAWAKRNNDGRVLPVKP